MRVSLTKDRDSRCPRDTLHRSVDHPKRPRSLSPFSCGRTQVRATTTTTMIERQAKMTAIADATDAVSVGRPRITFAAVLYRRLMPMHFSLTTCTARQKENQVTTKLVKNFALERNVLTNDATVRNPVDYQRLVVFTFISQRFKHMQLRVSFCPAVSTSSDSADSGKSRTHSQARKETQSALKAVEGFADLNRKLMDELR